MFRITEDPSSGSLVQCLAENYKNDLSCLLTWTCSVLWQHIVSVVCVCVCGCVCVCVCVCAVHCISYTVNCTQAQRSQYAAITPTLSMSTDTIESFL